MEKQLHKKYPDLKPLPVQHIPELLALFQEKKYFPEFYTKNIALTKQSIRHSVTDDTLIIQTIANIQELDRISNILSKRLREWYAWYCPEVAEHIDVGIRDDAPDERARLLSRWNYSLVRARQL